MNIRIRQRKLKKKKIKSKFMKFHINRIPLYLSNGQISDISIQVNLKWTDFEKRKFAEITNIRKEFVTLADVIRVVQPRR